MALRVLFLITDLEIGGTPRVVRDLAMRLRSPEIETSVACLSSWGPVADEIQAAGISVRALGAKRSTQLPGTVRSFRKLAADADVVFSFLIHANTVAAIALRRLPNVRLIEAIQNTQEKPRWHWSLQRWAAKRAKAIVVPTPSVATMAVERSGIARDRIHVIPNAIDIDAFANLPRPATGSRYRIGFIGRLDPIKRITDLLQAVAMLPDVELHIFGDGEDRASITQEIANRSIADRVILHGTVPSSRDAFPQIDCLVLPSDAEGFGLVLIEAMAAGVPVIATDVTGIRDVVTHESTGLLVPPRSPTSIAAAISRLRNDKTLSSRLIATAREYVSIYAWNQILPRYKKMLLNPAASKRR